ncbi:hypothetical protein GCM10010533_48400 [Mycolicibacterium pallens]
MIRVADADAVATGAAGIVQAAAVKTAAAAAEVHQASRHCSLASTSTADSAMPAPIPPNPHPARWAGRPCGCSSKVLTAITNTRALVTPATVRSRTHSTVVSDRGIPARLTTSATSDTRQRTIERATRGHTEPTSAPAR